MMDRRSPVHRMELVLLVLLLVCGSLEVEDSRLVSDRFSVYWNSSNPRFQQGEYTMEVSINDYLDIYCPHYEAGQPSERLERYVLFMVNYDIYSTCCRAGGGAIKRWDCNQPLSPNGPAIKRWECNQPLSPNGPIKFSEKFQLFTPFSLGFEFRPGREYYYISSSQPPLPAPPAPPCLKLKIYIKLSNDSLYESPEPFLTDENTGGASVCLPCASLVALLFLTLLLSSS